ncbi:MAG: O-sialoglycoprotein endopeptidase [Eubacteriales bacterium]|nr:O-sialoglycoprotein endopeptidase [Eubacteriales bacterium]
MKPLFLGVDTSNYTTSVACVSEEGIVFERRTMLSVALGERGLRQSDALFQHVRNLPELVETMLSTVERNDVSAVAVSAKPTASEQSYMPVFLAGMLAATSISASLHVPLYETTHQAGHVRAAMFGQEDRFMEGKFLAMHLSGGTTDLLLVQMQNGAIGEIDRIGGCDDLHAGQLVDRVGVHLGLPFPCGTALEQLANGAVDRSVRLPSSVKALNCSFSGQESQCQRYIDQGMAKEALAYAVYDCMARTFTKILVHAMETTGCDTILLSGGVSGSALLRKLLCTRMQREVYYAGKGLSSDNAAGVALLARDIHRNGR